MRRKFIKDFVCVYEKQGKIVSFISLKKIKILDLLFAYPKFTRLGLAKNLLDFALKEFYDFTSLISKFFFIENIFEIIRDNKILKEDKF